MPDVNHTPMPWEIRLTKQAIAIAEVGYMPHATVFPRGGGNITDTDIENAHLIMAAPQLLKAGDDLSDAVARAMLGDKRATVADALTAWVSAKQLLRHEAIDTSDIPEQSAEFFKSARLTTPKPA